MYGYDYEKEEARYVTKDSGERSEHPDGVVRDTAEGKPRFDLLFPKNVPFEQQLLTRTAELYERGGQKYGMRNWEKSATEETLAHHEAALMRHVVRFLTGVEDGEDHAAAVVWNVNAVDLCRYKLSQAESTETDELNNVTEPELKTYVFADPTSKPDLYAAYKIEAPDFRIAKILYAEHRKEIDGT